MKTSFTVDHEGKQYRGKIEVTFDLDGDIDDIECIEAFDEDDKALTEIEVDKIWSAIELFAIRGCFDEQPTREDFLPDTMDEDLR